MTIYIDFDNTIVESNKKIIDILNNKYGLSKSEADLVDYDFSSIAPINKEEKKEIFDGDDFFSNLQLKPGVMDVLNKYKEIFNFVVVTKGSKTNLAKKQRWIQEHIHFDMGFIGLNTEGMSKKTVDMFDSVQIDDCVGCLDTNAKIKILYKSNNDFEWQKGYENTNIIVANEWREIDEILSFYSKYDYETLTSIK